MTRYHWDAAISGEDDEHARKREYGWSPREIPTFLEKSDWFLALMGQVQRLGVSRGLSQLAGGELISSDSSKALGIATPGSYSRLLH